jgi:hypothetical protein
MMLIKHKFKEEWLIGNNRTKGRLDYFCKMEDKENNKMEEPAITYGSLQNRLVFFASFEEEQEAQYAYWRSLSPEERLEQHRILSYYVFSSFEKYKGNRLIFD